MKILLVITRGDDIGGAQVYLRELALRLTQGQHEVLVVTGPAGRFTDQLNRLGIRTIVASNMAHRLNPLRDVAAILQLRRIICDADPDIVSLHSSKAGLLGRIAAKSVRKRVIFTIHGWSFTPGVDEPQRTVYALLERALASLVDRYICVSSWTYALGRGNGIRDDKLRVIHNGIPDIQEPLQPAEKETGDLHVVMVARFAPPKRQDLLVETIASTPSIYAHFIGDGPDQGRIESLADRLGIADRVHFHGYQSNPGVHLGRYDAFVLLSDHEGFPLSTLEAMRAGLPVIVSDAGGAPEAVEDGVSGYVVPRHNPDILRARLEYLRDNPGLARRMGTAARQRFLDRFTFEHMHERTLAEYEAVVNRSGHGSG